jgi:hypothetical protein
LKADLEITIKINHKYISAIRRQLLLTMWKGEGGVKNLNLQKPFKTTIEYLS